MNIQYKNSTGVFFNFYPTDRHWLLMSSDKYISQFIRDGKEWEPHVIQEAKKHIEPNMNVIDAGANIGCYTVGFSNLTSGKVYSFEPHRRLYQQMIANVFINKCPNVFAYNTALGDYKRTVKMSVDHMPINYDRWTNFGGSVIEENTLLGGEDVQMKTLDSYHITDVCFIKIDVEGYELQVLKGAIQTIMLNNYPPILYECHGQEEVHQFIESLGYTYTRLGSTADFIATKNKIEI